MVRRRAAEADAAGTSPDGDAAGPSPGPVRAAAGTAAALVEPAAAAPLKAKQKKKKPRVAGLLYVSRVPPFMQPLKLRQLMGQHGEVLRIYMAPEDQAVRQRRKKVGGNRSLNFTEAWVEFADKHDAKRAALLMNGQQVGGKRFSAHAADLWCLKYLRKFRWEYLTEELAYQKAVKEQKLAAELAAAKRERDFYLSKVDQSKALAAIKDRKRKRAEDGEEDGGEDRSGRGAAAGGSGRAAAVDRPRQGQGGDEAAGAAGPTSAAKSKRAAAGGDGAGGGGGSGGGGYTRSVRQRPAVPDPESGRGAALPADVLRAVFGGGGGTAGGSGTGTGKCGRRAAAGDE